MRQDPGEPLPDPDEPPHEPDEPQEPDELDESSGTEPNWPPLPPREPRARRRGGTGLAIVVALLAAAVGGAATVALERSPTTSQAPATSTATLNTAAVSRAVEVGMVDVMARDGFSGLVSEGTGLILSPDGLVLTNNHVIAGATSVRVTAVTSGRTYVARVLGYDSAADVALLQMTGAAGLRSIETGSAQLGQPVLALGNAGGQGGTPSVTSGYVTALDQTITPTDATTGTVETLQDAIETSTEIVSGDSGGALVNARAQVIGMITASALGSQGNAVGYSIPLSAALRIVRLIDAKHTTAEIRVGIPGFLGVSVVNSPASCGELGEAVSGPTSAGAKICAVYPGTPAAQAGMRAGDVITAAAGRSVASANALTAITERLDPGSSLSVTYIATDGNPHSIRLTLVSGPAE
jgi:S1-C subfamily serine protease